MSYGTNHTTKINDVQVKPDDAFFIQREFTTETGAPVVPDANPPPTEGLLWPRFDHLLPAD